MRMSRESVGYINYMLHALRVGEIEDESGVLRNHIHKLLVEERRARRATEQEWAECPYTILNRGGNRDGDSVWEKRLYPGENWDEEEREEFIRDEWTYVHSPYDCSGEWFTWRIEVFNTLSGVVAYVFQAVDC